MPKLAHFMETYRHVDKGKREWVNSRWRLFVILLTIVGVLLIREYLETKYLLEFALTAVPVYLVLDKVMYWLLVGVVIGAAAAWLMHEGELAIAIWKALRKFEKNAEKGAEKAVGMPRERAKKRKKK